MAPKFEAKGAAEHRDELLAGVTGRIIEVGAGTGLNFRHYPSTAVDVVAIEPEPYLRDKAEEAATNARVSVSVIDGVADRLPVESETFDVGVASLVLCSVHDQAAALAELRRVIRPGGELRFYEHIRSHSTGKARAQRAVDVLWPHMAGGCHTSRDTVGAIENAGFVVEQARHFEFRPVLSNWPVAPHVIGLARRPT